MIVGKVTGSIVSTRKSEKLIGNKFMIVEPLESMKSHADRLVAIDNIGAGIGEYVLVAQAAPQESAVICRTLLWMRPLLES